MNHAEHLCTPKQMHLGMRIQPYLHAIDCLRYNEDIGRYLPFCRDFGCFGRLCDYKLPMCPSGSRLLYQLKLEPIVCSKLNNDE